MLWDRSAEVLGPVFTPAGGDDASVKEEVQGPREAFRAPETPSKKQFVEMARKG